MKRLLAMMTLLSGAAWAWQLPSAQRLADFLPPAPSGYSRQVLGDRVADAELVLALYTSNDHPDDSLQVNIIAVNGLGIYLVNPGNPNSFVYPCVPKAFFYEESQYKGFKMSKQAVDGNCDQERPDRPDVVEYNDSVLLYEGTDHGYVLQIQAFFPPPYDPAQFIPIDALLDAIDVEALAALGG